MEKEIPIIIDNNPSSGYEKRGWIYFLIVPVMMILAFWVALKKKVLDPKLKINTLWFDGISPVCREIKENATGWRALDIIYNYISGKDKSFAGKITDFWNQLKNAMAMRNRLKLVKRELKKVIENLLAEGSEIRLISIASGSAQGVIEIMKEFKERGVLIKAVLLDLNLTAIEYSRKLAEQAKITNQITFINKSARELVEIAKEFNPNIIEVVGFLEYRPKEKAIELIKRIHYSLTPKGTMLTSSISPNIEKLFLYYVINWPMFYRSLKQFTEIITEGGFKPKDIKIIYEPLKIQKIAVCQKIV